MRAHVNVGHDIITICLGEDLRKKVEQEAKLLKLKHLSSFGLLLIEKYFEDKDAKELKRMKTKHDKRERKRINEPERD